MDKPQRLARKEEQRTAELHGGRVTPASGSGPAVKNDVRNTGWSFEVKSTSKLSYSLRRDLIAQVEGNALADGRRMAMIVSFAPVTGTSPGQYGNRARRYVLTTEDDFLEREHRIDVLEGYLNERVDASYGP